MSVRRGTEEDLPLFQKANSPTSQVHMPLNVVHLPTANKQTSKQEASHKAHWRIVLLPGGLYGSMHGM